MSKIDFTKTQIPSLYSSVLEDYGYLFDATYADLIGKVSFAAVGDILREMKTLDKPVAFVINDNTGNMVVAAIVKHIPSEDAEHPEGNWNYVWTFDQADVTDDMNIADLSNEMNQRAFVVRAGNAFGMEYMQGSLLPMHTAFFQMVKEWLTTNAKEGDETEVELTDVFLARSQIEDGEVIMSIEPIGKMVQLIKDDAELEVFGGSTIRE